jgi:translocation and assembly module TamB
LSVETTEPAPPPAPPRRRRRALRAALTLLAVLALLVVALAAIVRLGVLTPQGRRLAETELNGLKLGGYGRLHVEGLQGDLWRDFSLRRLTVSDAGGAG